MTEAEPETQRVLPKALALYDKGVGIARIASQPPVGAFVQPAAVSHFPQLPAQQLIRLTALPHLDESRKSVRLGALWDVLGLPAASTSAKQPNSMRAPE
ncbi:MULTISPECIES: hypothetical protein [unclassified Streptomyces]|uniref:hypothetical protein n=1 Tax=unclassified Streptomyces TaxID=2593676 RepID=UPI0033BF98EA